MGIRDIYYRPREDRRPSALWEKLHPRQAEAYWTAEEQVEDWAYDIYVTRCDQGVQKGNPPDSHALDREIEKFSGWYPEVSELEEMRARYQARELELDLDAYEPFPWSDEWRRDHSEYERKFYWEDAHPELCADDQLRVARAAWLKTPEGQREQQARYGWFGEPWPDQAEQAIDEGRFVPTKYDHGITNEPRDELASRTPGPGIRPGTPATMPMARAEPSRKKSQRRTTGSPWRTTMSGRAIPSTSALSETTFAALTWTGKARNAIQPPPPRCSNSGATATARMTCGNTPGSAKSGARQARMRRHRRRPFRADPV